MNIIEIPEGFKIDVKVINTRTGPTGHIIKVARPDGKAAGRLQVGDEFMVAELNDNNQIEFYMAEASRLDSGELISVNKIRVVDNPQAFKGPCIANVRDCDDCTDEELYGE